MLKCSIFYNYIVYLWFVWYWYYVFDHKTFEYEIEIKACSLNYESILRSLNVAILMFHQAIPHTFWDKIQTVYHQKGKLSAPQFYLQEIKHWTALCFATAWQKSGFETIIWSVHQFSKLKRVLPFNQCNPLLIHDLQNRIFLQDSADKHMPSLVTFRHSG